MHVSVATIKAILEAVFLEKGGSVSSSPKASSGSPAAEKGNIADLVSMFKDGVVR